MRLCQPTLKQGHAGSIINLFLSGFFWLGAGLSQANVVSNKCVALTYLEQKVNIKIWKPGEKTISEKETYFSVNKTTDWRSRNVNYSVDVVNYLVNYSVGATC